MAKTGSTTRGGKKRMYKKPGRLKASKQYQIYLRDNLPMKTKGSVHEVVK